MSQRFFACSELNLFGKHNSLVPKRFVVEIPQESALAGRSVDQMTKVVGSVVWLALRSGRFNEGKVASRIWVYHG